MYCHWIRQQDAAPARQARVLLVRGSFTLLREKTREMRWQGDCCKQYTTHRLDYATVRLGTGS